MRLLIFNMSGMRKLYLTKEGARKLAPQWVEESEDDVTDHNVLLSLPKTRQCQTRHFCRRR